LITDPDARRAVEIKQLFELLDFEQRGYIDIYYMKQQFNTRGNPAILSRKMAEEEVIEE
jgi:hypothetical protein